MKTLIMLAALGAVACLTSCNTTIGFGRDLKLLGTGIGNKIQGKTWEGGQQQQDSGSLPTY